jgi:hypothetical protein
MMLVSEPAMPEYEFLAKVVAQTADLAEAVADFRQRVEAQLARADALIDRHGTTLCSVGR